ncbi:MAG: glycosyltransferase family protein, partial [Elusimicrobiota bacterium]
PTLELLIERLKRSKRINEIVVATSTHREDNAIAAVAAKTGVKCYQGSLDDVLTRVVEAVQAVNGDIIVEITGDCPLADPVIIDELVDIYLQSGADYVSNVLEATYPAGMDVQVFSLKVLKEVSAVATTAEEREHVSWLIYREPEKTKYKLLNVKGPQSFYHPTMRLMVDYKEDLEFITKIFEYLYPSNPAFGLSDIFNLLKARPELLSINSDIEVKVAQGQKIAATPGE